MSVSSSTNQTPHSHQHDDLSKVLTGDILIRDVYNKGDINGVVNVVSFDKATKLFLVSDGSYVGLDGKMQGSRLGVVYRLPQGEEIEVDRTKTLIGRLYHFDYETLPRYMLEKLNNSLDVFLERRVESRIALANQRAEADQNREAKELINKNPVLKESKWAHVGKSIVDWDQKKEDQDKQAKKFWKVKKSKIKKKRSH